MLAAPFFFIPSASDRCFCMRIWWGRMLAFLFGSLSGRAYLWVHLNRFSIRWISQNIPKVFCALFVSHSEHHLGIGVSNALFGVCHVCRFIFPRIIVPRRAMRLLCHRLYALSSNLHLLAPVGVITLTRFSRVLTSSEE